MPQSLVQIQKISLEQTQFQSALQLLASKLIELPIEGLCERVAAELAENPYLEASRSENGENFADSSNVEAGEKNEYDAKQDYSSEDDIPDYLLRQTTEYDSRAGIVTIESEDNLSLYDLLMEQAREYDLPSHDKQILEYIIGNLDNDGLLNRPISQLADELSIYHYCDTTPKEVERILHILWQFDPAGVGARSLQECLILQCKRKRQGSGTELQKLLLKILTNNWDDVSHNRWKTIGLKYKLSEPQTELIHQEVKRLNPHPGRSVSEENTILSSKVIPDVIIGVDHEGNIDMTLNEGDLPTLSISDDATKMLDQDFVMDYVNRGRLFIGAIQKRRSTILRTMHAIIKLQRRYFLTGDENQLRSMRLEDIAELTNLDLSTVSRVCNSKYVETPYGTHTIRWFFSTSVKSTNKDSSARKLRQLISEIVKNEDKYNPFSDDALVEKLNDLGYNVARRTVAKHREQLGIPSSRTRREDN